MLQSIYLIFFCVFFLLMLLFPASTFEGACSGLVLWFQTVLPTLLPFAIVSNLLINTNVIHIISRKIGYIFQKIFRVSPYSGYAIIVGFLCGYPMGAKTISDLVKSKFISIKEGQYLLSFCNNTSPMFIIGYLILQNFHDTTLTLPSLGILLGTPILCSFYFRKYYNYFDTYSKNSFILNHSSFDFLVLDHAIMNGFETITRVGGYIILFSIIFNLMNILPNNIFIAFLEITNGIPHILEQPLSYEFQFVLCHALVSFGGMCSVVQTRAMIQDSGLSIRPYIKEKLITVMVTSFIAYIYILFIGS